MSSKSEVSFHRKIMNCIKYFIIMDVVYIIPILMTKVEMNFYLSFILMIVYIFLVFVSAKYLYKNYQISFNLPSNKLYLKDIVIDIVLGIVTIEMIYFLIDFIYPIFHIDISNRILEANSFYLMLVQKTWPCVLCNFIMTVINAPIIEELIFRGFLFHDFFDSKHYILGAIVTSFIFALLHPYENLIEAILSCIPILLLFVAYHRKLNIKDAMLVHMVHNMIAGGIPIIVYYFSK